MTVKSPSGTSYQVSPVIAARVTGFLGELHDMGYDTLGQNQNFGYAPRDVRDSPGTPSQHSFGNAIDVNSISNHRLTHPEVERTGIVDSSLPANVDQIAAKYGLSWGGNYVTAKTDPMHFEGENYASAMQAASPSIHMGIYGNKSADAIDRFTERKAAIEGDNPAQAAIDRSTQPQTLGARLRETLGLPTTLGIQAVNGVISLGELAAAAASNVAAQSAAAQNPQAAPPSSFPSRPAGPVSSNQPSTLSRPPGAVQQGPDLSSPIGRMNAAIGRNPNAGVASATPTNDYRDTPQDRMRAAVGAPPAASYQGPGQRGFSQPAASSYDTLGMNAGPTGFSTGGMFSAGPQAMGAAMGSFSKPSAPAAAKQPAHPSTPTPESARPSADLSAMGMGLKAPTGVSVPSMTDLASVPTTAQMSTATLNQQIADALSTGYAPGAVSNKKPGEPGYQAPAAPAPSVPKLTPKMPARPAQAAPVAARPLAPPQSQFAPQTPVYNNLGSIVGAIGQAGQAYTPDFAPNTAVFNQNNQQVGTISGRTTQASPLNTGGLASLGGLFNNGAAALGSLGGFASAIGGYNTGSSKSYGNQTYGTRSYGGNGGSTLGGGDSHRAL